MERRIFYSWQSDLPNATNRGFIQRALEDAVAAIRTDDTLDVEPVIDRDTQGVAGSPDISTTIFGKIAVADVFVADVSIIQHPEGGRPTPNPNVLIELGYALRTLTHERVILIVNSAYGAVEQLPFDLRMRRAVVYAMPSDQSERAPERRQLAATLAEAVRTALASVPAAADPAAAPSAFDVAAEALEHARPNRPILLRRVVPAVLDDLERLKPPSFREGGTVDAFVEAVNASTRVVADFLRVVELAAAMRDMDAVKLIARGFGLVMDRYGVPRDFNGTFDERDFDYFRFHGHELFAATAAVLLRERWYEGLAALTHEPMTISRRPDRDGTFRDIDDTVQLMRELNERRRLITAQGAMLKDRYRAPPLDAALNAEDFIAGDLFLFLADELPPERAPDGFFGWRPLSAVYLNTTPAFLRESRSRAVATRIAQALDIADAETFRDRLRERGKRLLRLFQSGMWDYPIRPEDVDRIATAP